MVKKATGQKPQKLNNITVFESMQWLHVAGEQQLPWDLNNNNDPKLWRPNDFPITFKKSRCRPLLASQLGVATNGKKSQTADLNRIERYRGRKINCQTANPFAQTKHTNISHLLFATNEATQN